MPQTIKLSPEYATQKGQELLRLIEMDIRDRRPQANKRQYVREVYYGHKERQLDYAGQSNIHLHLSTEKIEGLVPKLVNAFWNADPIVHAERVAIETNIEQTDDVEQFLNWAIDADIPDFYGTFEMWARNMLLDSVSYVKTYWNREVRNTVLIHDIKFQYRTGDPDPNGQPVVEDRDKSPMEILLELFPGLDAAVPLDGGDPFAPGALVGQRYTIDFIEDRERYEDIRVEFHPSRKIDEVQVYVYRPIITQDCPIVEVVEFEDLILPYRSSDIQTAERVAHQYWVTIAQAKAKRASGEWIISDDDWELFKAAGRTSDRQEEHQENTGLKDQKDRILGELSTGSSQVTDSEAPYNDTKLLVYEIYLRDDLNNDGIGEEVIYHIPYSLKKVVQAKYLEQDFPHARRPFSPWHHIRISDRWYGISMAELLAPINVEVNAIINMVNEAQELINNPFFFYVPSALTVDPKVLENIQPGQGIPIGDINGVVFPKFPQEPLANLSTMDTLLVFADRLTLAPQSVGSSQVRNSPRTARGTLALLSEAGVKTDLLITNAQRNGWKELIHQIHALYSQFGPDEKFFRVTGHQKPLLISRDSLRGRYEFRFSGNSVNTNREVERGIAMQRYSLLISNPLYSMDMVALLELTKDLIRHFGEGVNQDKITPKLPQQGASHPPMDQLTEIRRILTGDPVAALPMDDHAMHIDILQKFMMGREFEMLQQWQVTMLAMHMQQHLQLLQQQVHSGALTPQTGGGQANNFPGAVAGNTGGEMSAMEGGVQ